MYTLVQKIIFKKSLPSCLRVEHPSYGNIIHSDLNLCEVDVISLRSIHHQNQSMLADLFDSESLIFLQLRNYIVW